MNIFGFNRMLRLQKEKYLKLSEALKTREKFWTEFHKDWPTWQSIVKEMVEKDLEEIMKEKKIVNDQSHEGRHGSRPMKESPFIIGADCKDFPFAPVNSHLAAERIHTEFKNAMVSPSGVKDLRKQVVLLKEEGLTEALDNINDKRNKLAQDITDLVNKFEKETEFNATVCHQKNIFLVSGSLGTAAQKRFKMSTNSNFVNQITVEISI